MGRCLASPRRLSHQSKPQVKGPAGCPAGTPGSWVRGGGRGSPSLAMWTSHWAPGSPQGRAPATRLPAVPAAQPLELGSHLCSGAWPSLLRAVQWCGGRGLGPGGLWCRGRKHSVHSPSVTSQQVSDAPSGVALGQQAQGLGRGGHRRGLPGPQRLCSSSPPAPFNPNAVFLLHSLNRQFPAESREKSQRAWRRGLPTSAQKRWQPCSSRTGATSPSTPPASRGR